MVYLLQEHIKLVTKCFGEVVASATCSRSMCAGFPRHFGHCEKISLRKACLCKRSRNLIKFDIVEYCLLESLPTLQIAWQHLKFNILILLLTWVIWNRWNSGWVQIFHEAWCNSGYTSPATNEKPIKVKWRNMLESEVAWFGIGFWVSLVHGKGWGRGAGG